MGSICKPASFLGPLCLGNTPLHQDACVKKLVLFLMQLPVQGQGVISDDPDTTKDLYQNGLLTWFGITVVA